jgi:multiple antibiotic resistance protein
MSDLPQQALIIFAAFFAIMNPISNTAVFVGLTGDQDSQDQRKTAYKALVIAFFIIAAFSLFGKAIFTLFGITLPALRIVGGILVFIIGYKMLNGNSSDASDSPKAQDGGDIAVSPLAVPLLAGPGTIATAMSYSAEGGWTITAITIAMFAVLCVITFFSFIFGQKIIQKMGKGGLDITTRLMGLILAVIGVHMLMEGLFGAVENFLTYYAAK